MKERSQLKIDEVNKVISVPDNVTLQELAELLMKFPEGEYKIMIHEFDETTDFEW